LLTTLAWDIGHGPVYALEGATFIAGAMVQWLRDGLGLIQTAREVEDLARTVEDSGGVTVVPALTGLGAPHWKPRARGLIAGLTRGSNKGHIARAVLEGIAHQIADLLGAMQADAGLSLRHLLVDGGAASNDLLMQFQADMLGVEVMRPQMVEATALGAAMLAGLGEKIWKSLDEVKAVWQAAGASQSTAHFRRTMSFADVARHRASWQEALNRA
jgi:glycerol kinase